MKKWLIKKINRRLSNVEGHRITAKERKIKRTIRWAILAVMAWVTPFTYEYTEHIVIENVYAADRGMPESVEDARISTDTAEDGGGVETEDGESVESMIRKAFPSNPVALAVFKAESGLDPKMPSTTDRMADGRPFSIGLTQINLTVHTIGGVRCLEAFHGRNKHAVVIDEALYEKCVKLAEDPRLNLETAKGIYERSGNNFGKWGAFTNGSYMRHL